MTAAIPNPLDAARYLPTSHSTSFQQDVDTYRAPCEVCGRDCDWTAKNPRGLCPCPDIPADREDAA